MDIHSEPHDFAQRAKIDRSLKLPLLLILVQAAVWLSFSLGLGVLSALKLKVPGFLDFDFLYWLNYGRLQSAFSTAFIYGWTIPVILGSSYWFLGRLTRSQLSGRNMLLGGYLGWNITVTLAVISILGGGSRGLFMLDFPAALAWPFLFSYALMAIPAILMVVKSEIKKPFVSVWFFLLSLLAFPAIFGVATQLINCGIAQNVSASFTSNWFVGALQTLVFIPFSIGVFFYLFPKLTGKALPSNSIALSILVGVALLGEWNGFQNLTGGPIPAWIPAISSAAGMLQLVIALFVFASLVPMINEHRDLIHSSPSTRFAFGGLIGYGVYTFFLGLSGSQLLGGFTNLTIAYDGFWLAAGFGCVTLSSYAALQYFVPRLSGCEWLSSRLLRGHFWLTIYGAVPTILLHFIGGATMGAFQKNIENWNLPFSIGTNLMGGFMIGIFLGYVLLFLASLIFLMHLTLMALGLGRRSADPTLLHPPHEEEEDSSKSNPSTAVPA